MQPVQLYTLTGSQSEEAHVQTLGALLGCAHILQIESTACHSSCAPSNLCAVCPLGIPQHALNPAMSDRITPTLSIGSLSVVFSCTKQQKGLLPEFKLQVKGTSGSDIWFAREVFRFLFQIFNF